MSRTAINKKDQLLAGISLVELKQAYEIAKPKAAKHMGLPRITDPHVINCMNLECNYTMISKVLAGIPSKRVLTAIIQFVIAFYPEAIPPESKKWLQENGEISQKDIILNQVITNTEAAHG